MSSTLLPEQLVDKRNFTHSSGPRGGHWARCTSLKTKNLGRRVALKILLLMGWAHHDRMLRFVQEAKPFRLEPSQYHHNLRDRADRLVNFIAPNSSTARRCASARKARRRDSRSARRQRADCERTRSSSCSRNVHRTIKPENVCCGAMAL